MVDLRQSRRVEDVGVQVERTGLVGGLEDVGKVEEEDVVEEVGELWKDWGYLVSVGVDDLWRGIWGRTRVEMQCFDPSALATICRVVSRSSSLSLSPFTHLPFPPILKPSPPPTTTTTIARSTHAHESHP